MVWTDWPASRKKGRAALAWLLIFAAVAAVASVDRWLAFVAAGLLLMSVGETLLPTRYRVGADGIQVRHPFRAQLRPYSRIGGWAVVDGGVRLNGTSRSPFLRRRQQLLLRCPGQEEQVAALLSDRVAPAGENPA